MSRTAFLRLEWASALLLIVVALGWAAVRGIPVTARCVAGPRQVAAGVTVGALLWLWIPVLQRVASMRRIWTDLLAPISQQLGARDIAMVAILSGISEELFFRGVLLPELGLVASSVIFGLLHALSAWYAVWATCTGAVLALLAYQTESLVTPMVAHAVYNLGALLILRSWHPPFAPPGPIR